MAKAQAQKTGQAKRSSSSFKSKCIQHLKAHQNAFITGLKALQDHPLSAWLAILAIGIVLVLPLSGYLFFSQLDHISKQFDQAHELTAFLNGDLSNREVDQVIAKFNAVQEVESIIHQTPESALKEFESKTNIGELVNLLPKNPLPHVLVISPKLEYQTPESMQALQNLLLAEPLINEVTLDIAFVQKLQALNQLVAKAVLLITIFIGIGCVVILSNTIRLSLERHRDEIYIYSLMGATDAYIRRPFIYRAVIYGLFGALTAIMLVMVALYLLQGPMSHLAQLYQQIVYIDGIGFKPMISLIMFSLFLSVVSAKLAIWQYNERLN